MQYLLRLMKLRTTLPLLKIFWSIQWDSLWYNSTSIVIDSFSSVELWLTAGMACFAKYATYWKFELQVGDFLWWCDPVNSNEPLHQQQQPHSQTPSLQDSKASTSFFFSNFLDPLTGDSQLSHQASENPPSGSKQPSNSLAPSTALTDANTSIDCDDQLLTLRSPP